MKLKRSELIKFEKDWKNSHPNVAKNPVEYISFLDGLDEIISKYDYELDERFFTYGRRDFLRKEFSDYLNGKTYWGRYWSKGKFNDAFVDLTDYYSGNSRVNISSVPEELNFREIDDADIAYNEYGIICKQEIDIISEMIQEFKTHLNNDLKKIPICPHCKNKLSFMMPDGKTLFCDNCNKYFVNNDGVAGKETDSPYTRKDVLY